MLDRHWWRSAASGRGPRRPWKHRNPRRGDRDDRWTTGTMCLYDPLDPRALRWEWDEGLEQYILRLQRHLFFEEFNRREGRWPVEDAPHGHTGHEPHPIRSRLMKEAVAAWTASETG